MSTIISQSLFIWLQDTLYINLSEVSLVFFNSFHTMLVNWMRKLNCCSVTSSSSCSLWSRCSSTLTCRHQGRLTKVGLSSRSYPRLFGGAPVAQEGVTIYLISPVAVMIVFGRPGSRTSHLARCYRHLLAARAHEHMDT
jgi:TRAP-type C4-dicarboxylate transport system permease large subunit